MAGTRSGPVAPCPAGPGGSTSQGSTSRGTAPRPPEPRSPLGPEGSPNGTPSSRNPAPARDEGGPLRQAAVARALHLRRIGAQAEVDRILAGAYRLIRRDGTVEPSMRDLLTEIGISTRSFYRHFPAKDDFLLVLVEDLQAQLTAMVAARMAAESEPLERVRQWLLGLLDQAVDPETATLGRPFLVQAARLREAYPEVYRTTGVALLELLRQAITDAVAAGQLRSSDPRTDARAIFHLTMSVMQSHVLDRTIPTPSEQDAVVGFALRAMR